MEEKNMSNEVLSQPNAAVTSASIVRSVWDEKTTTAAPIKKTYPTIDLKDNVFALLICLTCIAVSSYGIWGGFKGPFGILTIISFALVTFYLFSKETKMKPFAVLCGVLSCTMSWIYLFTSNGTVRFFGFIIIAVLSCVWFASLVNRDIPNGDLGLIKGVFDAVLKGAFENLPTTVGAFFNSKNKRNNKIGKILLGCAFAIPVLFVIVPLLMSSDEAFFGFVNKVFEDMTETVFKVVVGLLITPFAVSFCLSLRKSSAPTKEETCINSVENTIVIPFLSVISFCYILYLFSQLAYFFSAFKGFLPEGYSFNVADYARRGFFELSVISAINFIIIYGALLISKKTNGKMCIFSRVLCLFISVFTLIITATALSKMFLYIDSFGMTKLRITTSAFMIFLAVVFISFILRLFIPKVNVLKIALITASLVIILLGLGNVNRFVGEYNYLAYKNGALDSIDIDTIYELGDEGVPYLIKLAEDENEEVAFSASKAIGSVIRVDYYKFAYKDGILIVGERTYEYSEYNLPLSYAYRLLDEYIESHPENMRFAIEGEKELIVDYGID